jgi:hypothetical protein
LPIAAAFAVRRNTLVLASTNLLFLLHPVRFVPSAAANLEFFVIH